MSTIKKPPTASSAGRAAIPHVGIPGLRVIRSEIRKISATNAWWLFGIASLVITGVSMWGNMAEAAGNLAFARDPAAVAPVGRGGSAEDVAAAQAQFAAAHDMPTQLIKAA